MISILMVDDEPALLELTKLFLEKTGGFDVSTALSVREAARMMAETEYDAVVSDFQMPETDGLEFLKSLRDEKDDIPFILFTGKGREDVAIEALNLGANFYLQKGGDPVSQFAELANMVTSAVAARRFRINLAESEERFRLLAESSMDIVIRIALVPEMRFEYVSPSSARIIGYTPEDHYADPNLGMEMVHAEDKDVFRAMLQPGHDFSEPHIIRLRTKDGRLIWTEQRVSPVKDDEGRIVALEGIVIDITERMNAEQELKRSEAEYRKLVMTTPCLICSILPDGTTLFVNDYVRETTGYEPGEVIGKNWYDLFYPGELRGQIDKLMIDFAGGDVANYEMTLADRHGAPRTILWNSFNAWSQDGKTLMEINGAGIDVTAKKTAEGALMESGALNRAVLDSLGANIAVLDGKGKIIATNGSWLAFAKANGADLDKVGVGTNYIDVCERSAATGDELAGTVGRAIREVMDGTRPSYSAEYTCDSPSHRRWYVLQATPLAKRKGGAVVSHIDITARKAVEDALRESEVHYRSIFETAGSAMAIVGDDSVVLLINSEFERLLGYSKAEVEGRMTYKSLAREEDHERLDAYHQTRISDPENAPSSYHIRLNDRFGSEKMLFVRALLIPGTKHTVVSIVDETDRTRYEDAMNQVNRKLDLLAKITRHDILNQLSVLSGYLELAKERTTDDGLAPLLDKSRSASESIRRHLEFARDYQNMGKKRPLWIDVQAAGKRAASNIELKGIKVAAELGGLEVFSDPMLEKVFYNLMDNSIKHGESVTKISFRYAGGADGMRIIYEDDGVGIAEGDKNEIFEKGVADREGRRGYGLYLAREILGITGITLTETGKHGEGARFELLVPRGKYRTKRVHRSRKGTGSRRRD